VLIALADLQGILASGRLLISSVTLENTGNAVTFQDSATSFVIPLSFADEINEYLIEVDGRIFTLSLSQELLDSIGVERRVRRISRQLRILEHDFDSIQFDCIGFDSLDCISSETLLTGYF
jgi:hypothetical protein